MLVFKESRDFEIITRNSEVDENIPYNVVIIRDFSSTFEIYVRIQDIVLDTSISNRTHSCKYIFDDEAQYSPNILLDLPLMFTRIIKQNMGDKNYNKQENMLRGSGMKDVFENSVPTINSKSIFGPNNRGKLFIDESSISIEFGSNRITINDLGIHLEGQISKDTSGIKKGGLFKENTMAQKIPTSFVTPGPQELPNFDFNISEIIEINKLLRGLK